MLSSTFTDLKEHRQKVIEAIQIHRYKPNVMEYGGPGVDVRGDVIESSLDMVRNSAAYILVVSRKYGQTPFHQQKNPGRLSITELEFNEAMRLKLPILLFIMGEKHPVTEADIELDPDKREKLAAFRERAKRIDDGSEVERVFAEFESLPDFAVKTANAIGGLARDLGPSDDDNIENVASAPEADTALPRPPALAALPRYLGSHPFVGRASELQTLTDWCGAADPNPMLLFEAMGGSGKSMLTWEWLTNHAIAARSDWAGRFWYSFYEKGAVMADFCRRALAYMTMKPVEEFAKLRTPELADRLLATMETRPWLVVLDGLERVLVAYHRHDAAQLRDEEADTAADQIGKRDPCAAIRPADDDLLRRLAVVQPSKILVSSRLTPQALVNRAGIRVPGVRREILQGLRPADAEAMIRACGVSGRSDAIQAYLQTNCDCHPLVVGALAGLINDYLPDRGNFDRWMADPQHDSALNLAELDLVQKRNHILLTAIDALAPESCQLLQTLALLHSGAEFETLEALNPHLPPKPVEMSAMDYPANNLFGPQLDATLRAQLQAGYKAGPPRRPSYIKALAAWERDPAVRAAPAKLANTIRDLEQRGLLQYDRSEKRYDLHPVMRGVLAGRMAGDETQKFGQRVIDYLTSQPHSPWENAETLKDVAPGLQIVRVLLRMRQYEDALGVYESLSTALFVNLSADGEIQALLNAFFLNGWDGEPVIVDPFKQGRLLNDAAVSLRFIYPDQARRLLERAIALDLHDSRRIVLNIGVRNLGWISENTNRLAEAERLRLIQLDLARVMQDDQQIFTSNLDLFELAVECDKREMADRLWRSIARRGRERPWARQIYRPGDAEKSRAIDLFYRGKLTEDILAHTETLARDGRNLRGTIDVQILRSEWYLTHGEFARAVECLTDVLRMVREAGLEDIYSEALLALAHFRCSNSFVVRVEVERFSNATGKSALAVAELWRALGERDRAVESALRAHKWAVADGEPYVHRYYLGRTRALLTELDKSLPEVPRFDPSKVTPYPWENDVRAFIEKLQAEKKEAARKRKSDRRQHRKATGGIVDQARD